MKSMQDKPKELLRAMWRQNYQAWVIASKTENGAGGWKNWYNTSFYKSREEAESAIDTLIDQNPERYGKG